MEYKYIEQKPTIVTDKPLNKLYNEYPYYIEKEPLTFGPIKTSLYETGFMVPTKLSSDYCRPVDCGTMSMCRFPTTPKLITTSSDRCLKYIRPI